MYNVKYAIIISMNEEGNGATAPQVQNQAPVQPAKPTSAVNTGFDASKLGLGKKHKPEKVKKVKDKKDKETKKINQFPQNGSGEKTKRPLWFWIVLSVLAVAIVGAIVWMAIMLASPKDQEKIPTELTVGEGYEGDGFAVRCVVRKMEYDTFSVWASTIARVATSTYASQVATGGLLLLVLLPTVTTCIRTRRMPSLRIAITAATVLPFAVWYGRGGDRPIYLNI